VVSSSIQTSSKVYKSPVHSYICGIWGKIMGNGYAQFSQFLNNGYACGYAIRFNKNTLEKI
jgi:hypothetical protein